MMSRKYDRSIAIISSQDILFFIEGLKLGQCVDLLLNSNDDDEATRIVKTEVISVNPENKIIIEPISSNISLPDSNQVVEATILKYDPQSKHQRRLGFYSRICKAMDRVSEKTSNGSYMLTVTSEIYNANLRNFYRVAAPSLFNIEVHLRSACHALITKPVLIDLSASGALMSYRTTEAGISHVKSGDYVKLNFKFDHLFELLALTIENVRQSNPSMSGVIVRADSESNGLRYLAIQFLNLSHYHQELLHHLVFRMQQWLSSRHHAWGTTDWMRILKSRQY
jgi:c-di-GMP-binding flagellar brake protein YcgR